jgi:hypothetical protein
MAANGRVLSSKWDGLSDKLKASLFAVDRTGSPITATNIVRGPITDCSVESTANWQSPFEQAGADARAPAIMAMLQSGTLESYLLPYLQRQGESEGSSRGLLSTIIQGGADAAREAAGRSSMTKLNSTQVFTGAQPLRITLTMHFRAFNEPAAEVQEPVDQLFAWQMPEALALNSALVEFATNEGIGRLLPSKAPTPVALTYGGYTFAPMVIESVSRPLTVPMDIDGKALHVQVQVSLSSLTAMDSNDWKRTREGGPIRLFNNK